MTHALRPYPSYWNTGLPWLASLPDRWQLLRNKHLWREVNARSNDGSEELLTVSQYTGVTRRRDGLSTDGELLTNAASLTGHKRVGRNDLVVNIMLAWNGSLGVSAHDGIVSPAYAVFRAKDPAQPFYYHYLFRSPAFTGLFKTVSTGVVDSRLRLYPEVFFRLISPVPPPEEQAAIVRFLDHADQNIRRFVAAKRKLITLLNEQKQELVHRALTRGLNGVRLTPASGRSVTHVPEGWSLFKLKHCLRVPLAYGVLKPDKYDGPDAVPIVRITDVGDDGMIHTEHLERVSPGQDAEFARTRITSGDVVVSVVGTIGRSAVVSPVIGKANLSRALCRVQLSARLRPQYFQLFTLTRVFLDQAESIPTGTAQRVLNLGDLRNFEVPVPPIAEQDDIIAWLQGAAAGLNQSIATAKKQIELMREFRIRLISDAVTGQLDVRAAAAGLPEAGMEPALEPEDEAAEEWLGDSVAVAQEIEP